MSRFKNNKKKNLSDRKSLEVLSKFNENEKNDSSDKKPLEIWLSIANLIVTVFIGVFVAIYLNVRNEEFQKKFLLMQKDAELAHLVIDDDTLSIANEGSAIASELRIAICEDNPFGENKMIQNDFQEFRISLENQSIKYSLDDSSRSSCTLILLEGLAPYEEIFWNVSYPDDVYFEKKEEKDIRIHFLVQSDDIDEFDEWNDIQTPFKQFVTENYYYLRYTVAISCGNCVVERDLSQPFVLEFKYSPEFSNVTVLPDSIDYMGITYLQVEADIALQYDAPNYFEGGILDEQVYWVISKDANRSFVERKLNITEVGAKTNKVRALVSSSLPSQRTTISCNDGIVYANLRKSPGYTSKDDSIDLVAKIPCGEKVSIINGDGYFVDRLIWWNVQWGSYEGWIAQTTGSGREILTFE